MTNWSLDDSRNTYRVKQWSDGYVDIADSGELLVFPQGADQPAINLRNIQTQLSEQGVAMPVLVRFPDILRHRVKRLNSAFLAACSKYNYQGGFQPVYPVKVNQEHCVIEALLNSDEYSLALEAGSKPELLAVLGHAPAGRLIVCNGYKDRAYIRQALMGQKLGHPVFLVAEKPGEVQKIFEEADLLNEQPNIGLRVRLSSAASGNWQNSGGERAKFGLSASQIADIVHTLQQQGRLNAIKMLHVHLGSQIADINAIRNGVRELVRYLKTLNQAGLHISIVDLGGGLAVDYDGSQSAGYFSMNYTMENYADIIVAELAQGCAGENFPPPMILTESGRAMTAHHAVLLVDVIEREVLLNKQPSPPNTEQQELLPLWELYQHVAQLDAETVWQQLQQNMDKVTQAFIQGQLNFASRALADEIFLAACMKLRHHVINADVPSKALGRQLGRLVADKYFCNFSVFQSLPDAWALDQVFPVMPIHKLEQKPDRPAVLCDLTCDSDGQLENFATDQGHASTLPLHEVDADYHLAIFMVGAYQETLGDMHNLFGDTHSVNIERQNGSYVMMEPVPGDTATDLLGYVHTPVTKLVMALQRKAQQTNLSQRERSQVLDELKAGLTGYSYLLD